MGGFLRLAGTVELSGINDAVRPERVAAIAGCAARSLCGWPANAAPAAATGEAVAAFMGDGDRPCGLAAFDPARFR